MKPKFKVQSYMT